MIVVNANAGFQRMSREHLGIALALNIPIVIVVTKIDVAPQNVFEDNLNMLCRMLRSNAVKRPPVLVRTEDDLQEAAERHEKDKACPIFCVSNVTGEGLGPLRRFVHGMRPRLLESGLFGPPAAPAEIHIDCVYSVTGVGIVASGLIRAGRVRPNQQLLLGPDKANQFKPVLVRSIHYKRVQAEVVESGQAATFSLRSLVKRDTLRKTTFRKGMVLVDASLNPCGTRYFRAEVVILHHATTIRRGYQAYIHCGIIRQAAAVHSLSQELLRTGDRAVVVFRFMYHPEYLVSGATLLFREGRTKGLGKVLECMDESAVDDGPASGQA
uniref:Tr-type G domain-containing protein n=1 Tax=Zooxanthella nutricula TaxID=1333877 RepID=A0A7S2IQL1_9DINO